MPDLTLHTATVRGRTAAPWPPPARPAPATGGGTSHRLTSHRLTSPHLVDTCLYLYCIMMKLSCILYYLVITTSTTLWPHQATLTARLDGFLPWQSGQSCKCCAHWTLGVYLGPWSSYNGRLHWFDYCSSFMNSVVSNIIYVVSNSVYRVFAVNLQKRNWKIDTSLGTIGAQNLFSSLYKLGSNFLWIREV